MEPPAVAGQPRQQIGNAVVHAVLEQADVAVARAIEFQRDVGARGADQLAQALDHRRADHPFEFVLRGRGKAELAQRILHGAADAGLGIGQRAVEVEECDARMFQEIAFT